METTLSPEDDFPGMLLHQAALWDNYELLEDLLKGEQKSYINSQDSWGRTPLHAAAITNKSKCLGVLLKAGADPNIPCGPREELRTALHFSAKLGFVANIEKLLEYGATLVAKDKLGLTPLDIAERSEHLDCVAVLQEAANERENLRQQNHAELREACLSRDVNMAKEILQKLGNDAESIVNMAPNGANTLLFLCCEICDRDLVALLLDYGADGRVHPITKYSPLYIACYNGHREIAEMILNKFPALIRQWTVEKWLPIHAACIGGHVTVLDLLLNFNYPQHLLMKFTDSKNQWEYEMTFDINMKDASGQTSLYLTCLLGNTKMCETLLKFRVKATKVNTSQDVTPTSESVKPIVSPGKRKISGGVQNIMSRLNLKVQPEGITKKETEKQISPLLLDLQCSELRETALHVAVRNKCIEIASLLLVAGANPNICIQRISAQCEDDIGVNCLVEAAKNRDVAIVDMLLRHGARDDFSKALAYTILNKDDILTAKLLSTKAHPDPEYKLNKKAMTEQLPRGNLASLATLTYSSVFPSTPVMINWHGNRCFLNNIKSNWLVDAAINVNPKLKLNPKNQDVVLFAITRLDISNNALTSVPIVVFQLPSLRYLNLSQNKLETFPGQDSESRNDAPDKKFKYNLPVLEELCCQNNRLENIPEHIFRLPSLSILDVSNNKLQNLPSNMWSAPSLKELNASFNLLKDLPTNFENRVFDSHDVDDEKSEGVESSHLHSKIASPVHFRNYQSKDLRHQNLWSDSIEIAEQIVVEQCQQNCSQLSSLNLAHNLFTSVPPLLACLTVNLTRLNMSYNSLRSMSHVTTYPNSLKQLDLSYNAISRWPSLPQVDTLDALIMCYSPEGSKAPKLLGRQSGGGLRNIVLHSLCPHRRHLKLDNLRTLIVANNSLERIQLTTDEKSPEDDNSWDVSNIKTKLIFPNLSMLDISNNKLRDIPQNIHDLTNLSVLNISGNSDISELPAQMGLLSRLWNLNTVGCNLQEPLKTMIESKKYKTMDVIGYLKSVLEDARPYARMKLMIVGVQGIGKTSLLEQLRQEGLSVRRKPHEHWVKRMGNKNINVKTPKGTNMSTVGVDIGVWVYDKKTRGQGSKGPVMFRTWDFGGQKEYYATHQYFLSKRSLYLVVWKISDGHRGMREIRQWLVNIQARAPNSPVLIIGTHYDEIIEKNLLSMSEELQQHIRERFINVVDAEKCGLPRVLDTIEVSCRTRHNIKLLCNLIYDTAFSLRPPGSKELLLGQRVPATYLALEDVVIHLAVDRRTNGVDPVLNAEQYKTVVSAEMQYRYHKTFRDWSELHQATIFLHENGVLLHYEDATLRDFYFLDPQWLCDMLAHVVTIREINPFARSGLMKLTDLKHIFKPTSTGASDSREYIVNLLNKFEVALTWDNCTLLIPSLLPSEEDLNAPYASPAVRVKIPVRSRGWAVRSKKMMVSSSSTLAGNTSFVTNTGERVQLGMPFCNVTSPIKDEQQDFSNSEFEIMVQNYPEKSIRRLLLMTYFPSGFWSRLITRLLADDAIIEIVRGFFSIPKELKTDVRLAQWLNVRTEWLLWQTGMALKYGSITLFQMKEFLLGSKANLVDYRLFKFRLLQDGNWSDMDLLNSSILEIYFPHDSIVIKRLAHNDTFQHFTIDPNLENVAKLLALAVDHIDTLLEDWYPTLGTRFVHTSEGKFLVTRLIPCPKCLAERSTEKENDESLSITGNYPIEEDFMERRIRHSQDSGTSDVDSGVGQESNQSSRLPSVEGHPDFNEHQVKSEEIPIFSWMVEECLLSACSGKNVQCEKHGEILLNVIAPDAIFNDLGERHLIRSENITKGSLLGRGAFGFVFKGSCKIRGSEQYLDVAVKMLQPVQPGFNAKHSALIAYKVAQGKWDRDPLQYACKAYCTARQELNILLTLRHPNIVPLIGLCTRPLALVLDLAPQGALDAVLRNYRRSGDKIKPNCLQEIILQVAKAIEYLHQQHIIYRDLKSENVLVWSLPPPFQEVTAQVHVKLADYGISRLTLPSGSKGFGGTEGFMAPEMMRYNGEEEYTEKVDCFSFGMFIYELLTLHQPFEGHVSVKEYILEGGRPPLTHREILYPTCILDLMVLCWTQQPRDRPSASQIVSMASSPEFIQLCDCTALDHSGNINAAVPNIMLNTEESIPQTEVWLTGDGGIDLLSATDHHWQTYKFIPFGVRITAIAVVNKNIWIGDEEGNLHAYDAINYSLLWNYALGDAVIIGILHLDGLNRVAVGLTNGRLFLVRSDVSPVTEAMAEGSFVMTELGGSEHLFTLASLRIRKSVCELWVGEAMGFVSIFTIKDEIVSGHDRVNHYKPIIDKVERVHLFSSTETVYSYVYPGCMVYQWDVETREISSTLDCTKLVPCSESLKPLTLEDLSEKCQVTSVSIFSNCVYIGTAWGCVIVAERINLYPIMVFRPFEEEVKFIIPFFSRSPEKSDNCDVLVLAGKGYRSLSARNTDMVLTPSPLSSSQNQKLRMHLLLWKHCQ